MSVCNTPLRDIASVRLSKKVCETPRKAPARCAYEVPINFSIGNPDAPADIVGSTFTFQFEPEEDDTQYLVQDLILDQIVAFDSDGNKIDLRDNGLELRLQLVDYDGESYFPKTVGNESENLISSSGGTPDTSELPIDGTQSRAQVYDFGESPYAGGTRAKAILKTLPFLKHDVSNPCTLSFVVRRFYPSTVTPAYIKISDANLLVTRVKKPEAKAIDAMADQMADSMT